MKAIWTATAILELISEARAPRTADAIYVTQRDPDRKVFIGFASGGEVVFGALETETMTPFKNEHVELLVSQELRIDEFVGEKLFVLRIKVEDEYSALAVASFLAGFVQHLDAGNLAAAVMSLKSYLSDGNSSRKNTIMTQVGLLGELAFISACADMSKAVQAWHHESNDTYDFAFGSSRLEIKTTLRPNRRHWLKYSQFGPSRHVGLKLASVYTGIVGEGANLPTIIDHLSSSLDQNSKAQFLEKLSDYDWKTFDLKFDFESAKEFIRFYDSENIPFPKLDAPEIVDVSWIVDLEQIPQSSFELD